MVIVAGHSTRSLDRTGRMVALARILVALATLYVSSVGACSCISPESVTRERILSQTKTIVHARVTKVHADRSADIEVLETFKGSPPRALVPLSGPGSACGTSFELGEERIFFLNDAEVSLCDKFLPTSKLIEVLRKRDK
jgi:hypothetical protein